MYANSMHINRTNYKYTLNIDSLPYRNTISFGLFSNSVRNKCLGSNVPTNAAVCAVYRHTRAPRSNTCEESELAV